MKHYLFVCVEDYMENEGEEFLVRAETLPEAEAIAIDNFGKSAFIRTMTEWEAENSGLDEF